MNCEYTCKKKIYNVKEIERAQILFSNGDFVEVSGKEIVELDVSLYDKLVHFNDCFFPVAKSGFLKLKILNKKTRYDSTLVYNNKEYSSNRKTYIENRCAVEGEIFAIRFFNELNWHDTIFGNICAKVEEQFLILTFFENSSLGSSDSENHVINLKKVRKEDFRTLYLDFENCDGIDVYQDEIKEIKLNFEKELEWNSDGYCRVIKDGYIRLKFDKENLGRKANVYCQNKKTKIKDLECRICEKGEADVDICNLYITYYYCGYGVHKEEVISLRDLSEYPNNYGEDDCEDNIPYVTGYAKKEKDGSILITFGKKRQNTLPKK